MAVFIRAKQVTDPLNELVRARLHGDLTGYAGSSAVAAVDPSCFSLTAFLDTEGGVPSPGASDSESESSTDNTVVPDDCPDTAIAMLRDLFDQPPSSDPLRSRLVVALESAMATTPGSRGPGFRRGVVEKLRERGYNAGICMAVNYEYIDVVFAAGEMRYIVDVGFAEEFAVARATKGYGMVVAALPATVVARPDEVSAAVRIMAESAKRSLECRGMSVPPWRKKRYMMAKWLGTYRRIVNSLPAAEAAAGGGGGRFAGRRMVGFGR